jgi:hypothetical protein
LLHISQRRRIANNLICQFGFVPILISICACWHATNNKEKLPSLGQHHKVKEAKTIQTYGKKKFAQLLLPICDLENL